MIKTTKIHYQYIYYFSIPNRPTLRFGGSSHREDKENQGPRDRGGSRGGDPSGQTSITIGVPGGQASGGGGMIHHMIQEHDDEDGPILYRDDDGSDEEAEDRLAAKLARKDSLALKLSQRPDRQELIERNILRNVSDDERRLDRTAIGAKLIRRLSLRPSAEELEERNILKSKKTSHNNNDSNSSNDNKSSNNNLL